MAAGLRTANSHAHDNLPVLLAGGGAGTLHPGRHVKFEKVPMTNLYLSMLDRMGAKTERRRQHRPARKHLTFF
jgi:hypothetical protein